MVRGGGVICKKLFGKKYGKKLPVWAGLFICWFLIGFWHGGNWNYIIGVGLFQWFIIVLGELFEPLLDKIVLVFHINTECFSWKIFRCIRTTFLFMIGLSMFRCYNGMTQVFDVYKAAFDVYNPWILFDGSLQCLGLDILEIRILTGSLIILSLSAAIKILSKKSVRAWLWEQNIAAQWIIWIALIFAVITFGYYGPGFNPESFIYNKF